MSVVLVLVGLIAPRSLQAETPAGTRIPNIATPPAAHDGHSIDVRSNEVVLTAAERLDVVLAASADLDGPVRLTLTNAGNGTEAFDLRASIADAAATVRLIAIDRDGDDRFDPALDAIVSGTTPPLPAGGRLRLLVVLDAETPVRTTLSVTATAITASGAPGMIAPGAGDGGGDAIVGQTGARAVVTLDVEAPTNTGSNRSGVTLAKSQQVVAPDGSASAVHDAIVTYTLVARFANGVAAARIDDPVPAGTTYVPGSLRLDGAPLSDDADGDPGNADGRSISVTLGDMGAGTTRTAAFQVRIP